MLLLKIDKCLLLFFLKKKHEKTKYAHLSGIILGKMEVYIFHLYYFVSES